MNDRANGTLVEARDLVVEFRVSARDWRAKTQKLHAVDGASFDVYRGETLALVGESGCGKTTLGRTLLRLYEPAEGTVHFDGIDLSSLSADGLRAFRRRARRYIEQRLRQGDAALSVEQRVVHLRVQRERAVGEPFDDSELPERAIARQRLGVQLRDEVEQLLFAARGTDLVRDDVLLQVDRRPFAPQWMADVERRRLQRAAQRTRARQALG